jgi:uncharacterized protein YkwD
MRRRRRGWVGMGLVGLAVAAVAAGGASQVAFGSPTSSQRGRTDSRARNAWGPPTCPPASGPSDPITATIYVSTNADRARADLRPLAWNPQLYCLALESSRRLGGSGTLVHRDLNALLRSAAYRSYQTVGENLLRGSIGLGGNEMEAAWMRSPEHRANILSGAFTSMGVGMFTSPDGMVYVTENFGG